MVGAPEVDMQTFMRANRFAYMKASTFRLHIAMMLVLMFSCSQGPDRSGSESLFDSASDDVSLIQREIIRINGITSEIRIFTFPCNGKEVEITYYLDKGKTAKIRIDWPIVDGRYHNEEYYFKDGKLIFDYDYVERREGCVDCPPSLEKKTYIADDVVQYLENDSVRENPDGPEENQLAYRLYPVRSRQELREILCPML